MTSVKEDAVQSPKAAGFLRYVQDNPLATVAAALILGTLLARFAFLGNPKEEP